MSKTALAEDAARPGIGPHTAEDIDRYYADGDWQPKVLFQLVEETAAAHPSRTFVTDGELSLDYAALSERSTRLAAGLAGLGVKRGDRVAVQMPNWAEFATIVVALSRLGAVLVPLMPIFRHEEVSYIARKAEVVAIIGPQQFHRFDHLAMFRELRAERPALRDIIVARGDGSTLGDGEHALDGLYASGPLAEVEASLGAPASPDDVCLIVFTSGTTSRPKGCMHTFNTIYASSIAMARRLHLTSDDVFFNPSPVAHSTGLVTGLAMPIIIGGGTHFMPQWEPSEGMSRIAEHGCTVTYTATTFLQTVLQAYDPDQHDMSSMRYWVCAGAPIPGAVVGEARDRFPGCDVLSLYGRSENFTTAMCGPDDPAERSLTSDGKALPGAHIALFDRKGERVPVGEEGDVGYRGPSHMLGYLGEDHETAKLYTDDGFSLSGDLGIADADGFVRVSGRVKDIIIRGGLNISSREVEDLLGTHPAVLDVAVVAMPDARLGEKSCAFVVVAPDTDVPTLDDLTGYLREHRIAVQKLPERLEVRTELPRTPVGKVRKNVLRDEIAELLRAEG